MKYIYQKFREVCLLLAGAALSVVILPSEEFIVMYRWIFIVLALLLLFFGVDGGNLAWQFFIFWIRQINARGKKIAVWAPYEIDDETSSWISISRQQVGKLLDDSGLKYKMISRDTEFGKYNIVLNPYGGSYPESDVTILRSLDNIFWYVRKGGIFVNIADIPFYYAYDRALHRMVETTPFVDGLSEIRSFLKSLLTNRLHSFVFNAESLNIKGIKRVISLGSGVKNFHDMEVLVNEHPCSPYLAIPYGRGIFIFSTIDITRDTQDRITDMIKKAHNLVH